MQHGHLTLKHFILKQRAITLYRNTIRASRVIPDPTTRRETTAWIRGEIEQTRRLKDTAIIEDRLNVIFREIRQILPTMTKS